MGARPEAVRRRVSDPQSRRRDRMRKVESGMSDQGGLSRRQFVRSGGLLVAAATALGFRRPAVAAEGTAPVKDAGIPRKTLGRTGAQVSILGLGTAPMGHRN